MAVKEEKKEACKKVKLRRDAVTVHPNVSVVSSPPPRAFASRRSASGAPPVTNRPISPLTSTDESDSSNSSTYDFEIPESRNKMDYRRLSVDWILDSSYGEVSRLLRQLDVLTDAELIVEMVLHYSLVISGLPDCSDEDLQLAVYFFIEDTFGIQSRLVKCVKIRHYNGKMDVGVVFDSIRMKYDVLKKDELLVGTEVRITNNHTPWFGLYPGFHHP